MQTRQRLEQEFHDRLEEERKRLFEAADAEARARIRQAAQEATAAAGAQSEERLAALNALQGKLAALEKNLGVRASYERNSARVQRITLATLALSRALERPGAVTQEVAALQVAADGDPIVKKAILLLPREVHSTQGVATRFELRERFSSVARAGRVAALTPEEGGVVGAVVGAAKASIVLPATRAAGEAKAAVTDLQNKALAAIQAPVDAAKSLYKGASDLLRPWVGSSTSSSSSGATAKTTTTTTTEAPATSSSPLSASGVPDTVLEAANAAADAGRRVLATASEVTDETTRVRDLFDEAELAVAHGDFVRAIRVLNRIGGSSKYAAEVVEDWVLDARARLEADAAVDLIQARATVLSASLY